MKSSSPSFVRGVVWKTPGFTLIELLVSMAVLALVLVLMAQVVEGIMQSTRVQNQQMDSVASARRALDVVEADLRSAVITGDASLLLGQAGQPALAFLARRRGPVDVPGHRFLAIAYDKNEEGELLRSYRSVPFSEKELLAAPAHAPTSESVVSTGVLAWEVLLLSDSGKHLSTSDGEESWATTEYNGLSVPEEFQAVLAAGPAFATGLTNRARALEVWIAAVDEANYRLLEDSGLLSAVREALGPDPIQWRRELDATDIPSRVKSAARILHKTIALP